MYCQKCGKEILDEAIVCPGCGCAVTQIGGIGVQQHQVQQKEETATLANCSLGFAVLIPIVGLILSIIGLCKYNDKKLKNRSLSALFLSIGVWLFTFGLIIVVNG